MLDEYGRNIEYMRISITDRCNLRCRYCMPEDIQKTHMKDILRYEQILDICRAAVSLGIDRFKITGGEPLVRLDCTWLIGELKRIPGVKQVTMTSNGVLLGQYLEELQSQGLDGVNISLDTLIADRFREITGRDVLGQVMDSIRRTIESGMTVKINCVLQQGMNDDEWEEIAGLAERMPIDIRFIEMMPIGHGRRYKGISNETLLKRFQEKRPDMQLDSQVHGNGPAVYWKIPGYQGSVGFISAMHGKFCDKCNRLRLTAQGKIKPCLCYGDSIDLKLAYTDDPSREQLSARLREGIMEAVRRKPWGHCFESADKITESQDMVRIGG